MVDDGAAPAGQVGTVFMSYRREDSSGYANALQAKLEGHFGDAAIVRDLADIRPGVDFRRFISEALTRCSVLLALIGPRWSTAADEGGHPRLQKEGDLVRAEIAQGLLQEGMCVIPVLIGGARMPSESSVPLDISALCRRSAIELSDARWNHDVDGLIDTVQEALRERGLDVSNAYLRTLQRRFEEQGLECRTNVQHGKHHFGLIAKGACWNLVRQPGMNPLLRSGVGSRMFFSISVHRDLAPDGLRALCSDSFDLFTREHGRFKPSLSEAGHYCYSIAALTRPSTASGAFVREVTPRARGYLFRLPVIVDLSRRKVHVFQGYTLWGIGAYPFARGVAESVLGTWPTDEGRGQL